MLFNSVSFIFVFLPAVLLCYWNLRRIAPAAANTFLALASFAFYGWWNPDNLPILACSVAFNFAIGYLIHRYPAYGKPLLIFGIACDLAALAYYKYTGFLTANLGVLFGMESEISIELPIGISFFTFTQIAYLVDTYQRRGDERTHGAHP